jgi:DNA (cytosine-5)-methyltransferase 1
MKSPSSLNQVSESLITLSDPALDDFRETWMRFLLGPRLQHPLAARQLRSIDLFSSIGGLTVGLSVAAAELGMNLKPALAVDIDYKALDVYKANWPSALVHRGSVKDLVEAQVAGRGDKAIFAFKPEIASPSLEGLQGTVDVLTAGPPCQGHSSLNNMTRGDDPRNELYLRVPAIAIALDIPLVIIENVPGVVRDVGNVVDTAASLFESNGYSVTTDVLRADGLGWAQTRKRFFMIASKIEGQAVDLNAFAKSQSRQAMSLGDTIADLLDTTDTGELMHSLPVMSSENIARVNYLFEHELFDLPLDARPDCHKDGTSYSASYGRMHWDKPAPTLTTGFMSPGRGRFVHPKRPRVMTPREGARVQGFPDWYNFEPVGVDTKRTDLAKWIGDAVPSILGYVAGKFALKDY